LPDGLGGRHDVLLGEYGSEKSRLEYARIIAEWEAGDRRPPQQATTKDLSVNELILAFWKHAEEHYRQPDGTPTNELNDFRLSLKPLRELYGHTVAREFGPLALKAVRQKMIEARLCRGVINQRVGRIRRMFRWAVENELVTATVLHGLQAVSGLKKGRSQARETEPVKPVPEAFVNATLPYLLPPVAAMVRLQLVTGMRPGEVTILRAIDLDMTGPVWLYRPGSDRGPEGTHKNAYRGHGRIIAIGPRGQEIIRPWLKTDIQVYLFSPREAMARLRAEQRSKRKSKVQPSQQDRRRKKPKKRLGNRYSVKAYATAVWRACIAADRTAREEARKAGRAVSDDEVFVPRWHPHQLRHTKATEVRREFGLDAARVVLGHRSPQITETYAEIDVNKAAEVMARLG
jgi:integrase